ncbi:hypothetical protein H4R99_007880, partial [Coemansia sp. RSA 1722]
MAKSKVLMRVASKSSSDRNQESPEPAARPRTSAGEKGLLRRLRIGRMFLGFGSGAGSSQDRLLKASAGAGVDAGLEFGTSPIASAAGLAGTGGPAGIREMQPLHRLFRTGSAQLRQRQDDLVSDMHIAPVPREPLLRSTAHGLGGAAYSPPVQSSLEGPYFAAYSAQQAEARKSHYSVLSRRSSAPDIAEAARRLSQYADAGGMVPEETLKQSSRSDKDADCACGPDETFPGVYDGTSASTRADPAYAPVTALAAAADSKEPSSRDSYRNAPHSANTAGDAGYDNNSSGTSATFASATQKSPLLSSQPSHASAHDYEGDNASSQSAGSKSSSSAVFMSLPCTHPASTAQSTRSSSFASRSEPRPHMQENLFIVTKIPPIPTITASATATATASEQTMAAGSSSRAAPDIVHVWRQQRQSMPESPISPGSSSPLLSSPPGSGRSKRRTSYSAALDTSPCSNVNPTLILMGSVKQRGEKKGSISVAPATAGKSLLVPSKLSSLTLSSSESEPESEPESDSESSEPSPLLELGSSSSSSCLHMPMQSPAFPIASLPPLPTSRAPSTLSDRLTPTVAMDDVSNRESPSIVLLPIEEAYVDDRRSPKPTATDGCYRSGTDATKEPASEEPASAEISGGRRPRGTSMHRRPKSLYEKPTFNLLPTASLGEEMVLPSRASSSMASAKAFLTMIASNASAPGFPSRALGGSSLTIATTGSRSSLRQHSFSDLVTSPSPSSAPISGPSSSFPAMQPIERSRTSTLMSAHESDKADRSQKGTSSMDKSDSQASSPGSRSLRVRSRLAGVGIRRASTYVWNRSSVFMRSLSSADDLPESPIQQKAQEHGWHEHQPPHQELHQEHHRRPTEDTRLAPGTQIHLPDPAQAEDDAAAPAAPAESSEKSAAATLSEPLSSPVPAPAPALSSIPRPVASKKSPAAMRLHAARELVMTEKNFVDNLFVIKKVWMEPVFSSANSPKPIIPYQTARVVFNGISALHSHASQFYREMDFVLGSFERSQAPGSGISDDGMRIGAL